jgi:hypothetical protein
LVEFSPNWRLFSLGSWYITEVDQNFGPLFSTDQSFYKCWQKTAWATFWAIFLTLIWSHCLLLTFNVCG